MHVQYLPRLLLPLSTIEWVYLVVVLCHKHNIYILLYTAVVVTPPVCVGFWNPARALQPEAFFLRIIHSTEYQIFAMEHIVTVVSRCR